jgi:hypothetical protein
MTLRIGEWSRVSQPTVSRYLTVLEPVVATCLDELLEAERVKAAESDLIVDGFLILTADLTEPPGLLPGKRNAPGANALLITDLRGRPAGRCQCGAGRIGPLRSRPGRMGRQPPVARAFIRPWCGCGGCV